MIRVPWAAAKDQADAARIRRNSFRAVFGTEQGQAVLAVILADLGWNNVAKTPEEQALRNYATVLLKEHLGVEGTLPLVQKILEVPPA